MLLLDTAAVVAGRHTSDVLLNTTAAAAEPQPSAEAAQHPPSAVVAENC